ncbi:MAG: tRNA (adenosine(37)-N6)-dimethylallyltransferase MiaA [Cyclobacteriaceae bacterium]|nr:tRNA (adenosine(37)-N6)-dimethylallyltransferase MiaA [Cyclobacteriaceae bacterium HetDA_MAG_MS6]
MDIRQKHLICIVGPTAVGKTAMSVELAAYFGSEIISADSRQFYREMDIGTAKPSAEELARVSHHFINSLSIHDDYNAGQFEQDALTLLDSLFITNNTSVVVGGSGLYVKAICEGLDQTPKSEPSVRQDILRDLDTYGLERIAEDLKKMDPEYAKTADLHNPQRVVRAMEVIKVSGRPYSSFRKATPSQKRNFKPIKIGVNMERSMLYRRIDRRMDQMIKLGLFEEAQKLYPFRSLNALQTVGYSEIFDHLSGKYDREECIRLLKRNSKRYAKRQMTWFRKDPEISWITSGQLTEAIKIVENSLNT